jgi:hypothetical protein
MGGTHRSDRLIGMRNAAEDGGEGMIDYVELARLADRLFEISGDDDEQLAKVLDTLDEETRDALLTSDLLNAYQVFYYYFRETPDDLTLERLQLHAASELANGVVIDEMDIYEMVFVVADKAPVVVITDGEKVLARFSGRSAYWDAYRFLDDQV